MTAKNLPEIGKKRGEIWKNQEKEEKSGRKGKNREGSFTLPLLTDRAGYATSQEPYQVHWYNACAITSQPWGIHILILKASKNMIQIRG